MSKYRKLLSGLDLNQEATANISRTLDRTISGSTEVFSTPICNNTKPDEIFKGWMDIFNSKSDEMNSTLLELEKLNADKFGPRSIAAPWDQRRDGVLDYYGKDETRSIPVSITKGRLRPLSTAKAAEYIKNNTNSGLPFMVKKGRVKEQVVKDLGNLLKREDPCVLFTRTQENNKTRSVWGFPIADTLNEMMFYRPLLEYQRNLFWRSAVNSPEEVDIAITKLIDFSQSQGYDLVSIDFSTYDASIKSKLQDSCFNYIKSLFQAQYHEQIDYIANRFKTIGLVTPDGILNGPHGVPSGSTFTNEVDSIAQYLIANEFRENLYSFQIQGDDGAYATSDPNGLIEHFKSYGLSVNDDKSYISKDYLVYLQMLYHIDYRKDKYIGGIYPTFRALLRLCYQERFVEFKEDISGKDYYAIRTLSILENCKHHPLFTDLVKYVAQLDKYSLIPSDQGLVNYVKLRTKQDGKDVNFQSHLYGDSVTGIKDFESYKIIKSLSGI